MCINILQKIKCETESSVGSIVGKYIGTAVWSYEGKVRLGSTKYWSCALLHNL